MRALIITICILLIIILIAGAAYYYLYGSGAVIGKNIIITRTSPKTGDDNAINLDEIRIYAPDGKEINPVGAISSSIYGPQYTAGNILPGVPGMVHTAGGDGPQWVNVNLGSDKEIGKIVIMNRLDGNQDRAVGLTVDIVDAAGNVTKSGKIITNSMVYTFDTANWVGEV